MARKNLPVKISKELRRIEDFMLPSIYKAPTSSAIVEKARNEYFTIDGSEGSYAEVCDSYSGLKHKNLTSLPYDKTESGENRGETKKAKDSQFLPATIEGKKTLSITLSRDSLEEYRRKYNLDKLREKLIEGIVNFASFEEGLKLLNSYIHENLNLDLELETIPEGTFDENDPYYDEKSAICEKYPDITAEEVTWLSLVNLKKDKFVFDHQHSFFYPPSLIDMDLEGLLFSFGTVDERELDDIETKSPYKIGGLTGIYDEIKHQPFIHNISQAMKAIMLLKLSDNELFERIMNNEDIAPFMHGDTMLLKSFLRKSCKDYGIENMDNKTLEEIISDSSNTFTKSSVSDLREEIVNYFGKCNFRNKRGDAYDMIDSIKILGMLSRPPKFIEKGEPFDGYTMFYGNNIEFISPKGEIVDSVPLTDYLKHKIAYQFHDRIVSIDKREQAVRDIFTELHERIREKNINENNKMAIDTLQEKMLLEFGVFIPVEVYSHLKEVKSFAELYLRRNVEKTYIDRTIKFSYKEIKNIYKILKKVPKPLIKNVHSVYKKIFSSYNIEMFKDGFQKGGDYQPENKKITIFIPNETLKERSLLEYYVRLKKAKNKKSKSGFLKEILDAQFHEGYITRVFFHELGESVRENINPEIWNAWLAISPDAMNIELRQRDKYFLSSYATKSPHEDFCETFSLYILFGQEFKEKAEKSQALKAKYEFMKKIFSIDATVREFPNRYIFPMKRIVGDPKKEMKRIGQEYILKILKEEEIMNELEERAVFGDVALSYEDDILSIIRKHEARGESISIQEAARIASDKTKEQNEEREEFLRKRRISNRVYDMSLEILIRKDMDFEDANEIYDEFSDKMFEENKRECVRYLTEKGVKKSNAKKIVDKLHPIFRAFEEELKSLKMGIGKEETEELGKITAALKEEIDRTEKLENTICKLNKNKNHKRKNIKN